MSEKQHQTSRRASLARTANMYIVKSAPRPSLVFNTYWKFAAERQSIFMRRLEGDSSPWTSDPVLRTYKFTNVYRASDRTSQYLIRNVIYSAARSIQDVLFRILLFKLFNKAETWELLLRSHGEPSLDSFDPRAYDRTLTSAIDEGASIYSAAYIMPSGPAQTRQSRKHRMHLFLLEQMRRDVFFTRAAAVRSMREGYELLRSYPSFGPFLSYQFITDFNYSDVLKLSEMEFVVPGPGARDGLRKCFESFGDYAEADVIRWVADRQEAEFDSRELKFARLGGKRELQLIDCQNLFCEVDKYARVAHPEIAGITGRTRIKQKFFTHGSIGTPFYPPFWRLNDAFPEGSVRGPGQMTLL